jgi:hypothetical protein
MITKKEFYQTSAGSIHETEWEASKVDCLDTIQAQLRIDCPGYEIDFVMDFLVDRFDLIRKIFATYVEPPKRNGNEE